MSEGRTDPRCLRCYVGFIRRSAPLEQWLEQPVLRWKDGNEIINSHEVTIDQQGEKLTISAITGTGTWYETPAEGEGREDRFWRR